MIGVDIMDKKSNIKTEVSPAVIKRLPRYFRYLREIIRMGKTRVSSAELSGDDIILFDFTNADKELFRFLGDKKKIKITKDALKSLELYKAELI